MIDFLHPCFAVSVPLIRLLLPAFVTVEEVPDFISFNANKGGKGQGSSSKGKGGVQQADGARPAKRHRTDRGGGGGGCSGSRLQRQESEEGEQEGWEEDEREDAGSSAGAGPAEDPKDRCAPFLQVRSPGRRWRS